jgi:hypothetical protein
VDSGDNNIVESRTQIWQNQKLSIPSNWERRSSRPVEDSAFCQGPEYLECTTIMKEGFFGEKECTAGGHNGYEVQGGRFS